MVSNSPAKMVGVVLMLESPESEKVGTALLIRSLFKGDPAEGVEHHSYARGRQVFCHGKLDPDELVGSNGHLRALARELGEEHGAEIQGLAMKNLVTEQGRPVILGNEDKGNGIEDRTYLARIRMTLTELRRLAQTSDEVYGIQVVTNPDKIQPTNTTTHKDQGVPVGELRMSPSDILIIKEAFKREQQ